MLLLLIVLSENYYICNMFFLEITILDMFFSQGGINQRGLKKFASINLTNTQIGKIMLSVPGIPW